MAIEKTFNFKVNDVVYHWSTIKKTPQFSETNKDIGETLYYRKMYVDVLNKKLIYEYYVYNFTYVNYIDETFVNLYKKNEKGEFEFVRVQEVIKTNDNNPSKYGQANGQCADLVINVDISK